MLYLSQLQHCIFSLRCAGTSLASPCAPSAAGPASEAPYEVDGLSGATLTSNGVTNALEFWLGEHAYQSYLAQFRGQSGAGGDTNSKGKEG